MTATWAPEAEICEACGERLPAQPYAGNPRRFGCEACRVWRRRHPGGTRACVRCAATPVDSRPRYLIVQQQMHRRADVNATRRTRRSLDG